MAARLSQGGSCKQQQSFGKAGPHCRSGEVGRDEAAVAERPVMGWKRELLIRSRSNDTEALEENGPSLSTEGLFAGSKSFWFLEVELAEVEESQGGIYLIDLVISEMYETRASS